MFGLNCDLPRFRCFVCISRTKNDDVRQRAKRCQLLDRLMRRTVLAQTNRIVREDENYRRLHQGCKANRRTHVVTEIKERAAEWQQSRDRHPIQRRSHGVFAYAKMDIASFVLRRSEVPRTLEIRLVGVAKIG